MILRMIYGMIVVIIMIATAGHAVLVDGYCYLENQTDHSGTRVLFQEDSPGAVTDSVFTDVAGYYSIDVVAGGYDVYYTHDGFWEQEILDQLFFTPTTLPDLTLLQTPTGIQIEGELSGVLEDTTYFVIGDIWVAEGDSLTIEAGAVLIFDEGVEFSIGFFIGGAQLYASGTASDSIKFINVPGLTWGGIHIQYSGPFFFEYCLITGSNNNGINCESSSTNISNCTIRGNAYNGIECLSSSPNISNCNIRENFYGIACHNSSPTISNCTIRGNVDNGICFSWSSGTVSNCVITGNSSSGIHCYYWCDPTISNCTISGSVNFRF